MVIHIYIYIVYLKININTLVMSYSMFLRAQNTILQNARSFNLKRFSLNFCLLELYVLSSIISYIYNIFLYKLLSTKARFSFYRTRGIFIGPIIVVPLFFVTDASKTPTFLSFSFLCIRATLLCVRLFLYPVFSEQGMLKALP